jgi:hypothetical protein
MCLIRLIAYRAVNTLHRGYEQVRLCTYNVTLRRVNETIVAVEKQYVLHISVCVRPCMWVRGLVGVCVHACSPTYPACKAHVLYYIVIYGLSGYTCFGFILYAARFSKTEVTEQKMCFDFLYRFYLKHHSTKNWARYCAKLTDVFMWSTYHSC